MKWKGFFIIFKGLSVKWMRHFFLEDEMVKIWPKKLFFVSFCEFFCLCPLTPYELHPRFCQMKDFIKIYIFGKFHQCSISGCEIKNFQSFLYWFRIHEIAPFWVFWLLFPHLLFNPDEILTRGNSIKQTHCLKNPSKFWKFDSNGTH